MISILLAAICAQADTIDIWDLDASLMGARVERATFSVGTDARLEIRAIQSSPPEFLWASLTRRGKRPDANGAFEWDFPEDNVRIRVFLRGMADETAISIQFRIPSEAARDQLPLDLTSVLAGSTLARVVVAFGGPMVMLASSGTLAEVRGRLASSPRLWVHTPLSTWGFQPGGGSRLAIGAESDLSELTDGAASGPGLSVTIASWSEGFRLPIWSLAGQRPGPRRG